MVAVLPERPANVSIGSLQYSWLERHTVQLPLSSAQKTTEEHHKDIWSIGASLDSEADKEEINSGIPSIAMAKAITGNMKWPVVI